MPPLSLLGTVTKVGFMKKTATVTVARRIPHPRTGKVIERTKKYLVHDPANVLRHEDRVVIQNCPPVSARKRFKLHKVMFSPTGERERAKLKEQAASPTRAPEETVEPITRL